jgi:putative alpha-1,2-mannosidase
MSLALGGGKTLTVKAANNGPKNVYVRSARLNGQELTGGVVEYRDLMQGGELVFEMSDSPKL